MQTAYGLPRCLFQEVLRLERDAVIEFNFEKAYTQLLVVPVRQGENMLII